MTTETKTRRRFGPDIIQLLLPHRRPLLMVDTVEDYRWEPRPSLRATRHISANEEVFAGHFPGFSVWPGIYTIEGLGQACQILSILLAIRDGWTAAGGDPDDFPATLSDLDAGFHLQPQFNRDTSSKLLEALGGTENRMGFSSIVEVKLLNPVFAGQRLDYSVALTHQVEKIRRFQVEAFVERQPVARGLICSSGNIERPRIPR